MKIWKGYGSEHSMNLVMIGEFKEVHDAEEAKRVIDKLIEQVANDADMDQDNTVPQDRFTDAMSELLRSVNVYSLAPAELEQFLYDVRVSVEGNKVVITTDEIDVSAFLKVLLDKGARVEVYSAHDYPDTGYGR
jgi:hypothetical protein